VAADTLDWTPIDAYDSLLRWVSVISGRLFVGAPLNRDEAWIETSTKFTMEVFRCCGALLSCHWMVRPIMQYFIPEMQRLRDRFAVSKKLAQPLIDARIEKPHLEKEDQDVVDWYRAKLPLSQQNSAEKVSKAMLKLTLAAVHTLAMNCTHGIYELAARPEYQQILRDEIASVTKENNGELRIQQLQKLDSFIKETQRHNPLSIC
jgi:ent-kaurene oxidase